MFQKKNVFTGFVCLLSLSMIFGGVPQTVQAQELRTAKQFEKVAAPVVIAVIAAVSLSAGINGYVTQDAEVRAASSSDGPDNDDKELQFENDRANSPLETDLDADTFGIYNGELATNGYDPHAGWAELHLTTPLTSTAWALDSSAAYGGRKASANAASDTTPVRGADNTTAVASIAAFHFAGSVRANFTVKSTNSSKSTKQSFPTLEPVATENEITKEASGMLSWSTNAFSLSEDENGMVTIVPPVSEVELIHDFVQLKDSTAYRANTQASAFDSGMAQDISDSLANDFDTQRNSNLNMVPLPGTATVDFTVNGVTVMLAQAVLERGEKSDRELIEEYLMSTAITFRAPDGAQAGYVPNITIDSLVGGNNPTPSGSLFERTGGFGLESGDPDSGKPDTSSADLVGILIEMEGSLLDAMNMASQDVNHPLYDIINNSTAKQGDPTIQVEMTVQDSNNMVATSQANATTECLDSTALMTDTALQVGGDTLAGSLAENTETHPTDLYRYNSNMLLAWLKPECVTEVTHESSAQFTVGGGNAKQAQSIDCNMEVDGFMVCPFSAPPISSDGDWFAISMALGSYIPLNDNINSYQYGFVFDSDGKSGNNWVPAPAFQGDYFQGTDQWYSVEYSPTMGWNLNAQSVVDQVPTPIATNAIAVINGNVITLFVPKREFESSNPGYRFSAFRHSGDYGQNPPHDWSADHFPELDELAQVKGADGTVKTAFFGCSPAEGANTPNSSSDLALVIILFLGLALATLRQRLIQQPNN